MHAGRGAQARSAGQVKAQFDHRNVTVTLTVTVPVTVTAYVVVAQSKAAAALYVSAVWIPQEALNRDLHCQGHGL